MHIAYFTPEYPHERTGNSGGMGTSIKNLVSELVTQDVKVSVFVYGQAKDDFFEEGGINFYLLKKVKYPFGGFYFYRKHLNVQLNSFIEKEQIDVLEVPDWTGISAFMKFKIPVVMRFHGSDTYFCHIERRRQKWKNRFFEKQAVKKSNVYIAPTTFAGYTSAELFGLKSNKIAIIPYGLQLENFINEDPLDYLSFNIVNIGTLIRKKGVFQLAKIFNCIHEKFPKATLTLIGNDAPDVYTNCPSTWLLMQKAFTETALQNVIYLGKVSYDKVQVEIKKAHVCVFPSLAETLGMVTLEAMALRKAVVNTNMGWAQDLITDGEDGFLHHPDDIEGQCNSIEGIFLNQGLLKDLGEKARLKVESNFNIENLVQRNIDFYSKLLNS
ncbi:glycosyltransferase family 4 protein [Leeuwenhoekiella sp. H156]|uniref:glycosyltransferase family 4 protein n=1 Tax=Leeuwenhoekiella sp. H156 TaxID=3450128 RepID=UPI003FA4B3E9